VLPRELPPAPSWARPAPFTPPARGADFEEVAKIEQIGRKENAGRLACFRRWYDERRAEFAQGKPLGDDNPCQ
jgi:hypothetical protein